jgi:hypothetical protein
MIRAGPRELIDLDADSAKSCDIGLRGSCGRIRHDCTNACSASNLILITNADIRRLIALQAGKMSMKAIISDVRRHYFQRVASFGGNQVSCFNNLTLSK